MAVLKFPHASLAARLGGALLALMCCAVSTAEPAQSEPGAPPSAARQVITLCYERTDVRPWRSLNDTGLEFVLLREVEKRVGVVFDMQYLPWKRCLEQVKANQMDGAFAVSFSRERLAVGAFPGGEQPNVNQRLHNARYVLARLKGSSVQWDGKQFHNLQGPIGAQLGYSIASSLRAMGVPVDEGGQQARELLLKLIAKRIGAAALSGHQAEHLMRTSPELAAEVEILPIPLVEKPYFLVFSHQLAGAQPQLAARIWKTIEQVRNSPEYMQQKARAGVGSGG